LNRETPRPGREAGDTRLNRETPRPGREAGDTRLNRETPRPGLEALSRDTSVAEYLFGRIAGRDLVPMCRPGRFIYPAGLPLPTVLFG